MPERRRHGSSLFVDMVLPFLLEYIFVWDYKNGESIGSIHLLFSVTAARKLNGHGEALFLPFKKVFL